jgi:hypothetical protein
VIGSIDPLIFGQMMARIEHLSEQLERADKRMETLAMRLGEVEDRYKVGKAATFGAVLVLAAAVYGIKDLFARLVGSLAP